MEVQVFVRTPTSGKLTGSTAQVALGMYVEDHYPMKIKVHYIAGVLNCEKQLDGSYFVKCAAKVKNQYGKWLDCVVEGYVA